MNGDEQQGPNLNEFRPSWMNDGLDIVGEQNYPDFSSNQPWDTNAWSRQNEDAGGAASGGGCMADAGAPPDTGTYVLGSIDGTCQWIDTTTC